MYDNKFSSYKSKENERKLFTIDSSVRLWCVMASLAFQYKWMK